MQLKEIVIRPVRKNEEIEYQKLMKKHQKLERLYQLIAYF